VDLERSRAKLAAAQVAHRHQRGRHPPATVPRGRCVTNIIFVRPVNKIN
jgi:hypothetical protein